MLTRVLLDANILVSRTLRDAILIAQVEQPGMFSTCWTEDILAEALYHVRRSNPGLNGTVVARLRDLLAASMSERISDYPIVPLQGLTDADDLHVHAAAVAGGVDLLVTDDRDFLELPESIVDRLPYDILSADDFLMLADDSAPAGVHRMVARQWEYWRGKDPASDLPGRFRSAGCHRFAERVAGHVARL
ncbi:PIN domain-containing protein [Demequina soli]|uniref:PIN domain-containing protein n=1 Tax=Demequina soli TaxID=1638987 RepID=UPI000784BA24|nr:PIN domain-containing protein [Demequina soli]